MTKKTTPPPSDRLDRYLKTQNEHFNKYAFELYKMALESELFDDLENVLELFDRLNKTASASLERPVAAVEKMLASMADLNERQKAFICLFLIHYLKKTEFDGNEASTAPVVELLKIEAERLARPFLQKPKGTTTALGLRQRLKNLVDDRLEKLPDLLDQLEPKEQVNALLKMAALVLPRSESIHHSDGEANDFNPFNVTILEPSPLEKARSLKIEAHLYEK